MRRARLTNSDVKRDDGDAFGAAVRVAIELFIKDVRIELVVPNVEIFLRQQRLDGSAERVRSVHERRCRVKDEPAA